PAVRNSRNTAAWLRGLLPARFALPLWHGPCYNARAMDDQTWMRLALDEARRALDHDDVPIGAVVVRDGKVIARAHNRREIDGDPTAHAELLAIRQASALIGHWRLEGVTLYCTLEPCAMCAGAMVLARLPRLVYAAPDPKAGAAGSVLDLLNHPQLNHRVTVTAGVLAEEAAALIREFFSRLRAQGQK
ncbi:MAG: tRNA adenosine(34) deaminase TadA, partial [Aggregatilineaceae bacterium]